MLKRAAVCILAALAPACVGANTDGGGDGEVSVVDTGAGGDIDAGDDDQTLDDTAGGSDTPGTPGCVDRDNDGFGDNCPAGPDCNDASLAVNPDAAEVCGDGFDNNCDGAIDEGCPCVEDTSRRCYDGPIDLRGVGACRDGIQFCAGGSWTECSNLRPSDEVCDAADNDCDGIIDEGVTNVCGSCGPVPLEVCGDFLDNDCNDAIDDRSDCSCGGRIRQPCYSGPPRTLGFGICRGGLADCVDDRIVACNGEVLPGDESCDGVDNDCDGRIDEGLANACGVCGAVAPTETCNDFDDDCDGLVDEGLLNLCGECGAIDTPEVCGDGLDNNCDGRIDEGCACFVGDDLCWPGRPEQRYVGACRDGTRACAPSGEQWGQCVGARLPGVEICNDVDDDCDGLKDNGPNGCSVCATEIESCDDLDNDCDGQIDENLRNACGQCIDAVPPEEACGETCCDGVDNDCDGLVDEGLVNVCGTCRGACFIQTWGRRRIDWDDGTRANVEIDAAGRLRLGTSFAGLPFVWVANSGEATVSKIHTEEAREIARYPVGQSPSRTAVDFNGDVFVANRAFNGQGTVSRVDATDCTGEACSRFTSPIGPNNAVPRGIAIDEEGFPWVGTYNDSRLRRIDPATGLTIEEYNVGMPVYGLAIDAEGIVWFTSLRIPEYSGGQLGAFDTDSRSLIGRWTIPGCSNPYGIAIDGDGAVWLGNFTCNNLVKYDRTTDVFSTYRLDVLDRTRGVAVDADGMVWVASYGTNRVARFNPATNAFVGTYPVCNGPTGVGVAEDRHVWVPCYGSDEVVRLDYDGNLVSRVPVGRNPYSYSDLTGFQLRNFTARRGTWTVEFDCGFADCNYNELRWTADVPDVAEVVVRARVTNDRRTYSPWAGPYTANPVDLSGLPKARVIEIEIILRTSVREQSPAVSLVELFWGHP